MPVKSLVEELPKPQVAASPAAGYELTLMRHGIAVERSGTHPGDDGKRPLTPDGKKRVAEIARGLVRLEIRFDWVVTSPLVRAIETAEIVAEAFDPSPPLDFSDVLRPGATARALTQFLARYPHRRRTLVVGHEPDFSRIAASLIGAGPTAGLAFKKGGCCQVAWDEIPFRGAGQLVWWLPPRLLRRVS